MVLFFTSTSYGEGVTIYMGKDKFENEDLIRYAYPEDAWFHVDKLSSAHVYLRMPVGMEWTAIPEKVLIDCCQLVKANSIEGNKKNNLTIIYTPAANLKKTGDMAVGQVSFHKDKLVRRFHVETRQNEIVNRLNKTKVEREVDHEADRIERERAANKIRVKQANERKKLEAEQLKARKQAAEARSYDTLFAAQQQEKKEREQAGSSDGEDKDDQWNSDDDFM
ncbi:coiled-coil domain-containing protein 25 [Cystobasidium minutum MCA 4210]|uniref:coiled-coil domain-containing protein 25 n=1 Tax=Cystobasidium minutum MCA 4210 TaxID=1397322 RepID=UPI0034CD9D10|eukprot:jgi/Rhomi1/168404/fgenesh1_kg.2_\